MDAARYVLRRETPVRRLQDAAVARLAPQLSGKVIELGGFGQGRRAYATRASEYVVGNVTGEGTYLDAEHMDLPDGSVDGFISESMLEHVGDPERVISEVRRALRTGGRFLLLAPWMYPYHSAPEDFFRFSEPALRKMLWGFKIIEVMPLGNFWTAMATFAQLKVSPWREMTKAERAARFVVGAPLLAMGLVCDGVARALTERDDFTSVFAVLAERLPDTRRPA